MVWKLRRVRIRRECAATPCDQTLMFKLFKSVFGRGRSVEAVSKTSTIKAELSRAEACGEEVKPEAWAENRVSCALSDRLELPIKEVAHRFPSTIQGQLRRTFGKSTSFVLPVSLVREHLRRGVVRLPFGQLKSYAPSGTFLSTSALDDVQIDLPLQEIVKRLTPEQLGRRTQQTHVTAPEETPAIFGPTGSVKGAVRLLDPTEANRTGSFQAVPPAIASPSARGNHSSVTLHVADEARPPRTIVPSGISPVTSTRPVIPTIKEGLPEQPVAPLKRTPESKLTVRLERVISRWPEVLRSAVERFANDETVLQIPLSKVESGLKQGKIVFTWKQLRPWVSPPLSNPLDDQESVTIELPLAEIAPIFLMRHRSADTRTTALTSLNIPDIFTNTPRTTTIGTHPKSDVSAPSPIAFPVPPRTPEPINRTHPHTAIPGFKPLPTESAACLPGPSQKERRPGHAEILDQACLLPCVIGGLIATADGLLVGSKFDPTQKRIAAETLAGFVPQMYQRLAKYTSELGMTEPKMLTVGFEENRLIILKGGENYLALLAQANESLPEVQIRSLAATLSRASSKE